MSENVMSGVMPVLALRGLAVFPNQTVHFDVGREKSVRALDNAMKKDQTLLLIPQKDIMKETLLQRKEFMAKHKSSLKEDNGVLIQFDL